MLTRDTDGAALVGGLQWNASVVVTVAIIEMTVSVA